MNLTLNGLAWVTILAVTELQSMVSNIGLPFKLTDADSRTWKARTRRVKKSTVDDWRDVDRHISVFPRHIHSAEPLRQLWELIPLVI